LDAELSLGSDRYSDFLRDMSEYLAVYVAYGKDTDLLDRSFDLQLSTRVLQQIIDTDAEDVEAFYAQKLSPLHLRAVAENDDWDAYHDFRKRRRHARSYASPFPAQDAPEVLAVAPPNLTTVPTQDYCQLPLVA
jgi:hypothetical protein